MAMSGNSERIWRAASRPSVEVAGRHPDVHDHQLWPLITDQREQVWSILALPDDLETRTLQQAREALA